MKNLLVVGSVAFDSISTPFGRVEKGMGGSACHFTNAAFINPPAIVGVVGNDYPVEYFEFLEKKGADVSGISTAEGKTFFWAGRYEDDMNTAITEVTELGVFSDFSPVIPDDYKAAEYVFLANIDPELQLKVLDGIKKPKLTAFDTMNFWIDTRRDTLLKVFKRVDISFLNDGEARALTGRRNVIDAASDILDMGVKYVIIKKGSHGSVLFSRDDYFAAPVYPTRKVVDPTGAGDSFAGGFMSYVSKLDRIDFETMKCAVITGTVLASFNVEGFTVDGLKDVTLKDVKERYDYIKKITSFTDLLI